MLSIVHLVITKGETNIKFGVRIFFTLNKRINKYILYKHQTITHVSSVARINRLVGDSLCHLTTLIE